MLKTDWIGKHVTQAFPTPVLRSGPSSLQWDEELRTGSCAHFRAV